jgi:predicted transcriptional regulator
MKKDTPLAFRIPGELKRKLQKIADEQRRSVSQVCEILLTVGVEQYEKEGSGYLSRSLGNRNL